MKISRKPTPPRPTAPSRPSRLVLASLRDGEIVDVENISKYVTPELAYVVRVERAKSQGWRTGRPHPHQSAGY
jgi:hypothetical protein